MPPPRHSRLVRGIHSGGGLSTPTRHPRESGGPLDSRLRGNNEKRWRHAGASHALCRTCAGVGAETPPWRLESLGGKGWVGELPRGVPFGFQRLVRPHLLSLPPALLRRYAVYRGAPEEAETSQPSGWEAPAHSPMPMTPTGSHRAGFLAGCLEWPANEFDDSHTNIRT